MKLKKLLCLAICILAFSAIRSQVITNSWINYNQQYYKFKVAADSLYRIDAAALINAGFNLQTLNPKNLQFWQNGHEIAAYIEGEADNKFNTADYIEIYAEGHKGRNDSLMFINYGKDNANPYVSLINDTSTVFITINSLTNNKRFVLQSDINYAAYPSITEMQLEKVVAFKSYYGNGYVDPFSSSTDPRFDNREGYGVIINKGGNASAKINCSNASSSTNNAKVTIHFNGYSEYYSVTHDHEILIEYLDKSGIYHSLVDTLFFGYKNMYYESFIPNNQLGANFEIKITSIANPNFVFNNRTILNYVKLEYAANTDLSGSSQSVINIADDVSNLKTTLNLGGINSPLATIKLFDLTNNKLIRGTGTQFVIPNGGGNKKVFTTTSSATCNISQIDAVNGTGNFENYALLNLDSVYLIVTTEKFTNAATQYKTYRSQRYNTVIAYVEDLYDQFAYGIQKHPLAIRKLVEFAYNNSARKPAALLLLGKGRFTNDIKSISGFNACLVPAWGVSPSDNLFTNNLNHDYLAPTIAVGRLAAENETQILNYLQKVKDYESNPRELWMKNVIHFVGGADAPQQQSFLNYCNNYKALLDSTYFGANVSTFKKTSNAPVQIVTSDSVKNLFNEGVSIVTFFGHGSTTGFDQNLDVPSGYTNYKKYPIIVANSCFSGDIFGSGSISEDWVFAQDRGAIAFLASDDKGVSGYLDRYSYNLFKSMSQTKYGNPIGQQIHDAVTGVCQFNDSEDSLHRITSLIMILHGDPAVVINSSPKADYSIKASDVNFNTNVKPDSILVNYKIYNNGMAIVDSFVVQLDRIYPNGDTTIYYKKIRAPFNNQNYSFYIPIKYQNAVGMNTFNMRIDTYNEVAEFNENNNSTGFNLSLNIPGNDIIPVYPYKYAVVAQNKITLKASTLNALQTQASNYIFQVDTVDTFNSPFLKAQTVNSNGGVVAYPLPFTCTDSTVYFWRVSPDSTISQGYKWRESSFQFITGKLGWGQSHIFQYKNDRYQFAKLNRTQRRFDFVNNKNSFFAKTKAGYFDATWDEIYFSFNNATVTKFGCSQYSWNIVVFDSISGEPWRSRCNNPNLNADSSQYKSCHCECYKPLVQFGFGPTDLACAPFNISWQQRLENFLNLIPNNSQVLAYSVWNHGNSTMPSSLQTAFDNIGACNLRSFGDTTAVIIFGKKGAAPCSARQITNQFPSQFITIEDSTKSNWKNGFIESELIGPASKWNSLHWKIKSIDNAKHDSIIVNVLGVKNNGQVDTLLRYTRDSSDVLDLYNYVDATTYPSIKLIAYLSDDSLRTPPQLKHWYVLFDEVPEAALNPSLGYSLNKSSIQEGDTLQVIMPIQNISNQPFKDSLLITYYIEDANKNLHPLPNRLKKNPFIPNQVFMDTLRFSTYHYPGSNAVWIDVNPPGVNKYQNEQAHFNNVVRIPFGVSRDAINPLLDVTVDGIHIMNGDIVSSIPNILISLKDENKYLLQDDTSKFAIYLKYPGASQSSRFYFDKHIDFTKASLPENRCKMLFKPGTLPDGKYELLVEGRDKSDNQSGRIRYQITFEVINKATITEVLNYPNPFSTSTHFVFTLTGSQVPDRFKIQIMTITGKVVKEIYKEELGPLHIGKNITEYIWDGTDMYGDKLANGVYLYTVYTDINGSTIEKSSNEASKFFKHEIGKMYLMR